MPTPTTAHAPSASPLRLPASRRCFAPIVLCAWVALNHGWTLAFGFSNDDFLWIQNADLGASSHWLRTLFAPPVWAWMFFRPLVQLSFVVNQLLGGIHPLGYHLVNVGLHAANVLLTWRIALQVSGSPALALLTSALFAVHPSTSDAVAWVSGRTELICAFFYLAAVLMHLRRRLGSAVLLFAAALCSKESAISLPLVLLAVDILGPERRAPAWSHLAAYGAVAGVYCLVRAALVREFAYGVIGLSAIHPFAPANLAILLHSKITLLGQYVFDPLPVHGFVRSGILLGLAGGAVLVVARRAPAGTRSALHVGLAWAGLTLLPYFGWRSVQPWYLYLALAGASLALSALATEVYRRLPAGPWRKRVASVCLLVWLGASVFRLQVNNEYERRAGVATFEVITGLVAAVPSPRPGTLFLISGVERLRYGADPRLNKGVLIFGLAEAARLWYRDPSLDVEFGPPAEATAPRPTVSLEWDARTKTFAPPRS